MARKFNVELFDDLHSNHKINMHQHYLNLLHVLLFIKLKPVILLKMQFGGYFIKFYEFDLMCGKGSVAKICEN